MKTSLCSQAVIFSITFPLFAFSCTKTQEDGNIPGEPVQIELTAKQSDLVKSENTFSFDIFKEILKSSAGSENILISPLSISFTLSMATNGANGSTFDAMLEAIRVKDLTIDDLNISNNSIYILKDK